jgi:hypothetical protein
MKNRIVALCLLPLVLASCAWFDKKPQKICPQVAIVRELERISDYGTEAADPKALVASAVMRKVVGGCDYKDDGVDVTYELTVAASKGPRLGGDRVGFPFFVSIVDPDRKILAKELMTADFTFHGDDKKAEHEESLHVFIPMPKDAEGANYQVLMGFQLTEQQIKDIRQAEENLGR